MRAHLTGGVFTVGRYTSAQGLRLVGVTVVPLEPNEQFIRFAASDFERCDLRRMSWSHFESCKLIDCRLPEHGTIQDARGCWIEDTSIPDTFSIP